MPEAALVDVDGTLVDSNYHHAIAWSRALRAHGERARLAAIHRLVGMGGSNMLEQLIGRADESIERDWQKNFEALLPEIDALDRAGDLLRTLHARGLTVALATSSPKDLLESLREKFDADDAIDHVVTATDVESSKPDPDVFTAAAEKAGVAPGAAIVLGDSVWDVEAARRAGIACVALECGGFSRAELLDAGAVAVYEDPAALLEALDESPFAAGRRE